MHLDGKRIGKQTALIDPCIWMMSIMFKITRNTIQRFSLEEVLLMAAMNEVEGKRKGVCETGQPRPEQPGVGR